MYKAAMLDSDPVLRLLLQLIAIIVAVRVVGRVGRWFGQAQAVSEMVAGIVLGPSVFGIALPTLHAWLFPQALSGDVARAVAASHPSMTILYGMSQVGLVLYMFTVGLDFNASHVQGNVRQVVLVSMSGIAAPFALGAMVGGWLWNVGGLFPADISRSQAGVFLGAALSVTAFPVLARILDERRLSQTRVGTMALAAASMDDAAAWALLAVILAGMQANVWLALAAVAGGVAHLTFMLTAGRAWLRRLELYSRQGVDAAAGARVWALVTVMLSAVATSYVGLHSVAGAFVAGTVFPRGELSEDLSNRLSGFTTVILLPLFFVYSGLNTKIGLLNTIWLVGATVVVIVAAVIGKGVACTIAARVGGMSWREATALGILMNTRGLVELVILNIGLQAGVIGSTLFTMMVLMAVTTTVMTSPLFHFLVGNVTVTAAPGQVCHSGSRRDSGLG